MAKTMAPLAGEPHRAPPATVRRRPPRPPLPRERGRRAPEGSAPVTWSLRGESGRGVPTALGSSRRYPDRARRAPRAAADSLGGYSPPTLATRVPRSLRSARRPPLRRERDPPNALLTFSCGRRPEARKDGRLLQGYVGQLIRFSSCSRPESHFSKIC